MDSPPASNSLEVALIELEYAAADFRHEKASNCEASEFRGLERRLSELIKANRAVQIAIGAMGNRPRSVLSKRVA